jgi:hypothetical protein
MITRAPSSDLGNSVVLYRRLTAIVVPVYQPQSRCDARGCQWRIELRTGWTILGTGTDARCSRRRETIN